MRHPSSWMIGSLGALALLGCSASTPPCGSLGQPCCNSIVCNTGLACLSSVCAAPSGGGPGGGNGGSHSSSAQGSGGSSGNSSGGGTTTASSSSSSSGSGSTTTAPACGGVAQACCAGGGCNGSLVCQGGSCAQPSSGVAGTPCTKNADCPTGICLPVGQPAGQNGWTGNVCSTTCGSAADCVAGWSCAPLAGQSGNVCQCSYSPESCDAKDNDCNGIVDDEPAVDQSCVASEGAGAVCQSGSCVCGPGTTLCGGGCSNTLSDPANCGGCAGQGGATCPAAQSCANGTCVCPSATPTLCGTRCTDTQTDAANCGGCAGQGGKACPIPQGCVGGSCSCPTSTPTYCAGSQTCVDTQTDNKNCGGCAGVDGGQVCPPSLAPCKSGVCTCPNSQQVVESGTCCLPSGPSGHLCSSPTDCCTGQCVVNGSLGFMVCACNTAGENCVSGLDCCSGSCKGGSCQCGTTGACSSSSDCCTGHTCSTNGQCS